MVQKVIRYGNSQAVVLPKEAAAELGLTPGDLVRVEVRAGQMVIQPVEVVPKLSETDRALADELHQKRQRVFDTLAE